MIKYIITWVLVTTIHGSRPGTCVLTYRQVIQKQQAEFSEKQTALDFYSSKMKESNAQYTYIGGQKMISCPKCFEYIDSVKFETK